MLSQNQKLHAIRPGEIVFEIDNEHLVVRDDVIVDPADPSNPEKFKTNRREIRAGNSHHHFPPVPDRQVGQRSFNFIRTRQELIREGAPIRFSLDKALQEIDFIPGERIHINLQTKVGRITDAIYDPENESIYMKLLAASQALVNKFPLGPGQYVEKDLSRDDSAFWTWIFHMRIIADGDVHHNAGPERNRGCATSGPRFCRPVQNIEQLPTREECAKSLKVKLDLMDQGHKNTIKEWDEMRKKEDPNYKPVRGSQIVLTPYLAGIGAGAQEE